MSSIGDAFSALKNVLLMQERLDRVQNDVAESSSELKRLTIIVHDIDKRLYALERLVDLGAQRTQKRIEK